jgi:acetolactate synthase-1/3 small subunit
MSDPLLDGKVRDDVHTVSLLVANKPGVLLRIALVFSRRGFNIESLVVSATLDGKFSRMTITAQGNPEMLDQIVKQVGKLVDVVHACEHQDRNSVDVELALIKLEVDKEGRKDLLTVVRHFKSQTVDITHDSMILQVTGTTEKLNAMIEMLSEFKILEIVRTGKVVMARGLETT